MPESPSIEALLAQLVDERVRAALAPVVAALDEIKRSLPPQLGDVARVVELTGLSPASVRRRIADGTFATVKAGGRVLIDLASLRPASPESIAKLAREARDG